MRVAYPEFFAQVPTLTLRDPLADFLGAAEDGLMEYAYADAVRLAGHSCPTVAGSWLMARAALKALYGEEIPERGGVEVTMHAPEEEGTTGVMAQVFTLLTGAAAHNGFHGIGGRFARSELLRYDGSDRRVIASFRRRDTGDSVEVTMDLSGVPFDGDVRPLMMGAMSPDAEAAVRRAFGEMWQGRVRRLLLEHADDPEVIRVMRRN